MALHGDIRVNGDLIGSWSARRTTALSDQTQVSTYECDVRWFIPRCLTPHTRQTFTVEHRYSDGAATLAAKVLAECNQPPPLVAAPLASGGIVTARDTTGVLMN